MFNSTYQVTLGHYFITSGNNFTFILQECTLYVQRVLIVYKSNCLYLILIYLVCYYSFLSYIQNICIQFTQAAFLICLFSSSKIVADDTLFHYFSVHSSLLFGMQFYSGYSYAHCSIFLRESVLFFRQVILKGIIPELYRVWVILMDAFNVPCIGLILSVSSVACFKLIYGCVPESLQSIRYTRCRCHQWEFFMHNVGSCW